MSTPIIVGLVIAAGVIAFLVGRMLAPKAEAKPSVDMEALVEEARKQADIIRKEAELKMKEELLARRTKLDEEIEERRAEFAQNEKRIQQREETLGRKEENLDRRDERLGETEKKLMLRQTEVEELAAGVEKREKEVLSSLERVAGMSAEDAKEELKETLYSEARHEAAKNIREIEDEAKKTADKKAKEIISLAIQRYAGEYVSEKTVSSVQLPNEEM